jgi:hypothetical protein
LASLLALAVSCTSVPRYARPGDFTGIGPEFSGEIVAAHRNALRGLGPRWPGSQADQTARAYLARGFRSHGAKAREASEGSSRGATGRAEGTQSGRENLIAEIPGSSEDVLLLVAAYPVLGSSGWIDDTGAAILLELARVFEATTPAYSLRFALAEIRPLTRVQAGDAEEHSDAGAWARVETVEATRQLVIDGGRSLAAAIRDEGGDDQIRAVIVLDFSTAATFRFTRDLLSHPGFRALFWDSAARLGEASMFPRDASWGMTGSLQLGLREAGVNRILALVSDRDPVRASGAGVGTSDSPSIDQLTAFGRVMSAGLNQLMYRFEKVDAFSR